MKAFTLSLLVAGLALAAVPASAGDLKVGDMAPDFTLKASDGKTYALADFKGKQAVVLAWFPKAFTQGCTIECKSLAEHGDMIKAYDATYFMISVDRLDDYTDDNGRLVRGNVAFAQEHDADFPLLSDPTKATANAYGVLNDRMGVANRWTFYIGKDGKILAIDQAVRPATSAEDMAAKLGELGVPKR